jgi:2-keto-4-pentenoate hydratase
MTDLSRQAAERAAELLLGARRSKDEIAALPEDCRPRSERDAWAIQNAFVAAGGLTPCGWKLGATSRRAQDFLGVERPFPGRVFAETTREIGPGETAAYAAGDFLFRLIEPEFCLRLGRRLEPGAAPHEVAAAVETAHPAVEIVTSAYGSAWTEVGGFHLMADNAVHGALLIGPGQPLAGFGDLLAHEVHLSVDDFEVGSGTGAAVEGGGPLGALAWLSDALAGFETTLEAGALVTTGVVTPFTEVEAGQSVEADFGSLGRLRLRFD